MLDLVSEGSQFDSDAWARIQLHCLPAERPGASCLHSPPPFTLPENGMLVIRPHGCFGTKWGKARAIPCYLHQRRRRRLQGRLPLLVRAWGVRSFCKDSGHSRPGAATHPPMPRLWISRFWREAESSSLLVPGGEAPRWRWQEASGSLVLPVPRVIGEETEA